MKKALFTMAITLFLAVAGNAQELATGNIDPNAPEIKFDNETIDYGVLEYDGNTLREYKFKNVGKTPLIISNVQVQCGCTNVDGWPKEPIAPGKTATFKVKYDSKRPGKFDKKITVTSNAKNASVVLTIKGEVKPQAVADPATTPPASGH